MPYVSLGSRPDNTHALGRASRTSTATEAHLNALKRIVRYLKRTREIELIFKRQDQFNLEVYSDAYYASDASRKSISGVLVTVMGTPIAWKSKLQKTVSLSTCEAEFYAGCEAAKTLAPIRRLLLELQLITNAPTKLFIDNTSALKIATDERTRQRTKHIDERAHYLYQKIEEKEIFVEHVPAQQQKADILTKPLPRQTFTKFRLMLALLLYSMVSLATSVTIHSILTI